MAEELDAIVRIQERMRELGRRQGLELASFTLVPPDQAAVVYEVAQDDKITEGVTGMVQAQLDREASESELTPEQREEILRKLNERKKDG